MDMLWIAPLAISTLDPHNQMITTEIRTDRPGERLCVHQAVTLPGVQFWSVTDSERHWGMFHETFTACLVLGQVGVPRGRWRSRGQERTVSSGCMQLMEPGETHRTTAVTGPASFFVTWWTPTVMADAAAELDVPLPLHWRPVQLEHGRVSGRFGALHRSVASGAPPLEIEAAFAAATRELVTHASESIPRRKLPGRWHPGVRRAVERLTDQFTEAVCLDELAKEARVSKFHLARCFQSATGFAPHQYQKRLRLQAARRHLEQGLTVEESASRAGFSDGPHLTRAFREWLGVTPGAWSRAARVQASG